MAGLLAGSHNVLARVDVLTRVDHKRTCPLDFQDRFKSNRGKIQLTDWWKLQGSCRREAEALVTAHGINVIKKIYSILCNSDHWFWNICSRDETKIAIDTCNFTTKILFMADTHILSIIFIRQPWSKQLSCPNAFSIGRTRLDLRSFGILPSV